MVKLIQNYVLAEGKTLDEIIKEIQKRVPPDPDWQHLRDLIELQIGRRAQPQRPVRFARLRAFPGVYSLERSETAAAA